MDFSKIEYAPWKVVRQLGQGSFGSVFEIRREEFGETYVAALKVISIPQDESEVIANRANGMDDQSMTSYYDSVVQELTHEFAILSKLKGHTNIVGYEDHKVVPHANGIGCDIYIRMELLRSLTEISSSRTLNRQEVIKLGLDICQALCLCEKKAIIHRDIKPDNIFISENGDFELGDFGIARTASRTISNMSRKGTPNYMAPEVYKNQPYNSSVDIYSLGIVLYQLMNNKRLPFIPVKMLAEDRETALGRRMSGEPLPMPEQADPEFARTILKACAYNQSDRYFSAEEMMRDLNNLYDDTQSNDGTMKIPDGYNAGNGYMNGSNYGQGNGYPDNTSNSMNGYQNSVNSGANGYGQGNGYSNNTINGYGQGNGYPNNSMNGYGQGNGYANNSMNGYRQGNGYSNNTVNGYGQGNGYPDNTMNGNGAGNGYQDNTMSGYAQGNGYPNSMNGYGQGNGYFNNTMDSQGSGYAQGNSYNGTMQNNGAGSGDGKKREKKKAENKKALIIVGAAAAVIILVAVIIGVSLSKKQNQPVVAESVEPSPQPVAEEPAVEEEIVEEPVQEAEDEPTEPKQSEAPADLGVIVENASLGDFVFELEGYTYQLPVSYADFVSTGWSVSSNSSVGEDDLIAANSYEYVRVTNGAVEIYAYIYNASGNTKAVKDCNIGGIEIFAKNNLDFQLAKGITCLSTVEEITAAYGAPASSNQGDDYTSLRYTLDSDVKAEVYFMIYSSNTTNNSVDMKYFPMTADDVTEVSTEAPEYLSSYTAPETLSNDVYAPQFELDGALYQLPCPLSAFTDNGWMIAAKDTDTLGSNNKSNSSVKIQKGDNVLYLDMYNFSMNGEMIENCAVVGVRFDPYYLKSITADYVKMPGGLNLGSTMEDVEKACTGFDKNESNSSVSFSYYNYGDGDLSIRYYFNTGSGLNPTPNITLSYSSWNY